MQDIQETTLRFHYMFSFAVATHHLLREIRVNHQNIKEADIYLECSCVSLVSTWSERSLLFTPGFPLSLLPQTYQQIQCRRTYLWCMPSCLCVCRCEIRGDGGNRTRGRRAEWEGVAILSCWVSGVSKQDWSAVSRRIECSARLIVPRSMSRQTWTERGKSEPRR